MQILNEILSLRREHDINWFEDNEIIDNKIEIESYDNYLNYNNDIY